MTKEELQFLEDSLLEEFKTEKAKGEFDAHAKSVTRLYEVLYLVVHHLNTAKKR